ARSALHRRREGEVHGRRLRVERPHHDLRERRVVLPSQGRCRLEGGRVRGRSRGQDPEGPGHAEWFGNAFGGALVRRRVAFALAALTLWAAGSAVGSVGPVPSANAQSLAVQIGKAHAGYTPRLGGTRPIFILTLGSDARPGTP